MRQIANRVTFVYEETEIHMPERLLLMAILERAIRDLELTNKEDRRSAISWFKGIDQHQNGVSYAMVVDNLSLSDRCIKSIEYKVKIAETFYGSKNKCVQEGQEGRTGDSELVKGQRVLISQTYPAAQRRGRIVRYNDTFRAALFTYRVQGNE